MVRHGRGNPLITNSRLKVTSARTKVNVRSCCRIIDRDATDNEEHPTGTATDGIRIITTESNHGAVNIQRLIVLDGEGIGLTALEVNHLRFANFHTLGDPLGHERGPPINSRPARRTCSTSSKLEGSRTSSTVEIVRVGGIATTNVRITINVAIYLRTIGN